LNRLGSTRAFMMVSGTLNRENRCDRNHPPRAGRALRPL
jgi:hypothetical protein